ncbi:MAG: penicillin-binding protein, partial [Solirubrobacteraceae bacterium]|nr:penicillin-binding protein [Solirubrobacteraceae bacterium]
AGDRPAMWRALTPRARAAHPEPAFARQYGAADRIAGVRGLVVGRPGPERSGRIPLAVAARTADFGTLAGTVGLPVSGSGAAAGVDWDPSLRLPGLRPAEAVARGAGRPPPRAPILAADGTLLDATAAGSGLAGQAGPPPTGLQRLYDRRLAGHPSERLLFGGRIVARTPLVRGRSLRTTISPRLMAAAATALGGRLGGVAVLRPSDGAVLALAGLAVSAPQPPGSTFKIVTLAAALEHGLAQPSSTYPVATYATLSGVKLTNASGEACGGSLTEAFSKSCNSVFAPLGARLGAARLVAAARAFGFGEQPAIPAARPSTISAPGDLRDDLAVGAAAIGQDRDLATPLEMASIGATIAAGGRRAAPRIAAMEPVRRRRVVPVAVADQVRAMMLSVVGSGTGTAAAIPGVAVAGKTGTAELRPHSTDPRDADAWFVAFAPAGRPTVAVAVMLVGAGFGGTAAAPIARQVLQAALG